MPRITEKLLRKRIEHNDGCLGSLEEISLHQEDLEKLEHLQYWCKDLKILLLHGNLITKIENVGRLKKLEYINFSLNNIERIENLEGCETLNKLDFTCNFIGDLISVKNLKKNWNLKTLYLVGNPCCDFKGYRQFIVATLPHLENLDGEEILISERIKAQQNYYNVRQEILEEQELHYIERESQKIRYRQRHQELEKKWKDLTQEERDQRYWQESSENSPEVRTEMAERSRKNNNRKNIELTEKREKKEIRLFKENGEAFCINEARIPFQLNDDKSDRYVLDIAVYKHMDTNLLNIDIQPTYVKVLIKDKIFQLRLNDEIAVDRSTAQRSQTTGHLVITMPKAGEILKSRMANENNVKMLDKTLENCGTNGRKTEYLEVGLSDDMDYRKIVERGNRRKSEQFIDNDEVPPLIDD